MAIAVLGPLTCDVDTPFGRRDRAVLTALAICLGRVVSPDQLADAVWGETPPATAHKALQGCILRLRKALGADVIETSPRGYRLVVPADEVDFRRFERMVSQANELLALEEPERAKYVLTEALELWRGRAFEDVEDWELALIEAGRLDELRLEAEELRVDASLRVGRHMDVVATAESMVRAAPMRERRWALLAVAQYRAGRQVEALRTVHRVKALLREKLGLDVGPELAALEELILRQDESLLSRGPIPGRAECPYRGLAAYDIDDSDSFFGRERDVQSCLALLREHGSVAVVGPSGSGKSSLVRAGVAAALRRAGHEVIVGTPGPHPMQSIAAPADAEPGSVLLIDQCEEVFALCQDERERQEFFAAIDEWTERGPVVLAMRADRLSEVAAHPRFARLLERSMHLLGAMTEEGLTEAVESPARQAGLLVEPGLVNLIVGEVAGAPGALPMLSHALQETWKGREGNTLTVEAYAAAGGIRGAVAQSAENVYANIGPGQRHLLRNLVLRLVTAGVEGEPVRSRVPRRLLASDPESQQLIDLLVAARLVSSDSGVVEIAHEALARQWPRLRGWIDDDVAGQRILHHLTGAADAWQSMGRPDSELYRGVRLAQALEWREGEDATLTEVEVAFLEVSKGHEQSERRAVEDRARAQARLIARLRVALVGGAVVLLVAVVAGVFAVEQRETAEDQAAAAVAAGTVADARRAGARALATDDLDEAMLLAVAGVQLDDSVETRSSLLTVLGRYPELIASTQMAGAQVLQLDVSPSGRTVATYDVLNHVRLYELATGTLLAEYQAGHDSWPTWVSGQARFSPDGRTLAVVMAAPTRRLVTLLDPQTLVPMDSQPGGTEARRWQFVDLAFSPDGGRLAAAAWRVRGSGDAMRRARPWVFVWDLQRPQSPVFRKGLPEGNPGVALNVHGDVLFTTGNFDTGHPLTRHEVDVGTSEPVPDAEPVERLATSPNGRFMAGSVGEAGLVLLDPQTGQLVRRLEGTGDIGFFVNFSDDSRLVGTVTYDNREAVVWDVATAGIAARLPLGEGGEWVDFSPTGATAYTAGRDSSLRHWDLEGSHRFIPPVAPEPSVRMGDLEEVQPAPDGGLVAYTAEDRLTFLEVESGAVVGPLPRGDGYRSTDGGAWHPDGRLFALPTGREIRVWDAGSGELVRSGSVTESDIQSIAYSTDGSRLVIGELSGRVMTLDPATLAPLGRPVLLDDPVTRVAAGPDDATAVALTGTVDPSGFVFGATTQWSFVSLEAGRVLDHGRLDVGGSALDIAPDGSRAAIGGGDGEVLVLDLQKGEPLGPPVDAHDSPVVTLTYSEDGAWLLTSAPDSTVALWDAETGMVAARLVSPVRAGVATFIDGHDTVLIAPEIGGSLFRWDTRIEHALDFACAIAGRDMTGDEWHEVFEDRPHDPVCS